MKSKVIINIKGKNIDNFIRKLNINGIELYKIKKINRKEVNIKVNYSDINRINDLKTIYELEIVEYKGLIKLKKTINENLILIIIFLIGLVFLYLLTNTIFSVQVIHNEEEVRTLLIRELRLYGIDTHKQIKTFKEIEEIKKQILEKYKNKIEWLEIERVGTKYIIRLELRKIPEINNDNKMYHIIAKKDAIIKKIEAKSGEKIKELNTYVKKGDIIISGNIMLNDNKKGNVSANGNVYGEVWYEVSVEYPFIYNEEIVTGKNKITYTIDFLSKSFPLFDFKPYKNKKVEKTVIFKNLFIPYSFTKQKEQEVNIIEEINTIEQAKEKAIALAQKRIEESLKEEEYVIDTKILSTNEKDSKIECVVFFTVYENITDFVEVELEGESDV